MNQYIQGFCQWDRKKTSMKKLSVYTSRKGGFFLDNETIKRYRKENKEAEKNAIVFTGSSLMEQFPVEALWKKAKQNGKVFNRGVSGFDTTEFLQVIDTVIFDLKPRILVINIGTNDLNNPNYQQETLLKRIEQLFEQVKKRLPHCRLIFLAFYPVNEEKMLRVGRKETWLLEASKKRNNKQLMQANQAIASLCKQFSYEFVDVNKNLKDEKEQLKASYTSDGIHLYSAIYNDIFQELLNKIDFERKNKNDRNTKE